VTFEESGRSRVPQDFVRDILREYLKEAERSVAAIAIDVERFEQRAADSRVALIESQIRVQVLKEAIDREG